MISDTESKKNIDKAILDIRNSENYFACGIWTQEPKNWFDNEIIGKMLENF